MGETGWPEMLQKEKVFTKVERKETSGLRTQHKMAIWINSFSVHIYNTPIPSLRPMFEQPRSVAELGHL